MAQSTSFSNINPHLTSPLFSSTRRTLPRPLPFVSNFLNYRALPLTIPRSFVLRQLANSRSYGGVGTIRATTGSSGSQIEESIQTQISENPVVVYSKTWCPYCQQTKSLFEDLGVKPYVVELDELGGTERHVQNALQGLTGQSTVPNVFIGKLVDMLKGYGEDLTRQSMIEVLLELMSYKVQNTLVVAVIQWNCTKMENSFHCYQQLGSKLCNAWIR